MEARRTSNQSRRPLRDISNVSDDHGQSSSSQKQFRTPGELATSSVYHSTENSHCINGFAASNHSPESIKQMPTSGMNITPDRFTSEKNINHATFGHHMDTDSDHNSNVDYEAYYYINFNTEHEIVDELIEDDSNIDIEGGNDIYADVTGFDGYWDIGDPTYTCEYCDAFMWFEERARKDRKTNPKFNKCCMQGKVQLPKLRDPPKVLQDLYTNQDSESKNFQENTRPYNMVFSFTSMGGKIDSSVNKGRGPFTFRLYGQNYHRIGSLLPTTGSSPKFSQLYIYDTENEVSNRLHAYGSNSERNARNALDDSIVERLREMLDAYNPLAQAFRVARDRFESNNEETYNLPTASEVAALIVGDIGSSTGERDIIVETQMGQLKRINELHPSYLPLQYPLLFPYGEDGYRLGIQLRDTSSNRKR
ncbi:uncharacterized protein [Spinacia oleracea]|uniref:Helitron helicase-like domain-containing protein n=1 Tax=Spinacia oleracea TaxID=3562 RepID=A0ABM3R8X5_SPIOL|nr:uncharacterized protein LOC130459137 [Spinacia oleracea]